MEITIIIPTKNGSEFIGQVLASIFGQKTHYTYEVIIIDSGSIDNTLDIVKNYKVRLYQINPEDFSHSKTRNYGASLSQAEKYLIFLNQDAIPTDDRWLENMVKSIEYDPELKASCAIELNPEANEYFNVISVGSAVFCNSKTQGIYIIEPYLLQKCADLPKAQQRNLFPFGTVCAIFDKQHFAKLPFNEKVDWGEDLHWAVDNSNAGYKSACSSFAKVFHRSYYKQEEFVEKMKKHDKLCKDIFGEDYPEFSYQGRLEKLGLPKLLASKIRKFIAEL
ncbi:hypothetical protein NIES2119_22840 [[Phormidium ambiguum] IAM M-71]|uniref:Glycosyltransferase 2-like domain-containing protein n=1 Tax=[Phormidium ambiguum] IAM M-71 TaxID=454136 RepID=A0A1U7IAH4_9CYAN|nr:glycosyltransferase [Phormidium ambiguum]OKH33589.1 hypothetical protein NIES2119_22840 [Phormidium ambiguum IAM M-71]